MTGSQHSADAHVDQLLTASYYALAADLADILDIETGLQEAMLPRHYGRFVGDVAATLDIESGLARVIPPRTTTHSDVALGDDSHVTNPVMAALAGLEPRQRLALRARTDVADSLRCGVRVMECADGLAAATKRLNATHTARAADADAAQVALAAAEVADAAQVALVAITAAEVAAYSAAQVAAAAITAAQVAADAAYTARAAADVDDDAYAAITAAVAAAAAAVRAATSLAAALTAVVFKSLCLAANFDLSDAVIKGVRIDEIAAALNDLTCADLRTVDLSGIDLTGIQWSETGTRWPSDRIDQIRRDSEYLGDGVYEIRPGTTTLDGEDALLPR